MTLGEFRIETLRRLSTRYDSGEARWMTRIIFEKIMGYSQVDTAIKSDQPISEFMQKKINETLSRLLSGEPIQYVFGETEFYGISLKVSPGVLIPRPETEELVEMIVKDANSRSDLRVLDVCTGSGCIAIALARNLKFPQIEAIDISDDALSVAKENLERTRTSVTLRKADALALKPDSKQFDIIVSNPPYIAGSERASMDSNVVDHEPAMALFVPDDDPLRFYIAIASYATQTLSDGGRLYFELNPLFAEALASRLTTDGWNDVRLHRDMQAKIRFLSATKPES